MSETVNVPKVSSRFRAAAPLSRKSVRCTTAWVSRSCSLRVERRHCNALGICHGGVLLTLADVTMGTAAMYFVAPRKTMLTVSLSCSFQTGCEEGQWVQAGASPTGHTLSLAFASVRLDGGGRTLLSGVGTFHIPKDDTPHFDLHQMLS